MKISSFYLYLACFAATFIFYSCETEFTPEIASSPSEIVVEGYIEAGDEPTPPYVLLTKTFPFYNEISQDQLNDLFVHDAIVKVNDGESEVTLTELCLNELSPTELQIASELFGFDPDTISVNFCIYIDLSFSMMGKENTTYDLTIETEGQTLTASTYIPYHVRLDFIEFIAPPAVADSLLEMECTITDPDSLTSYYRYFTNVNDQGYLPGFTSVFDDAFIDGLSFTFPLQKSETRDTDFDPEVFGLYTKGDTVTVKWTTIDKEHFDFWNTLEFNTVNQGPFSNYTKIETNIDGGVGIWGGYNNSYYTLVVE